MTLPDVNHVIQVDPGLTATEKQYLIKEDTQRDIAKFLAGSAGAVLGVVVAKYMRLSRPIQLLLGALGYGAGKAVYNFIQNAHTSKYNKDTNAHEIDSKRF